MADNGDAIVAVTPGVAYSVGVPTAKTQPVSVSLFGALSRHCRERPLLVEVPLGATVAEVIEVLGRRLGSAFLEDVRETTGEKFRTCRIFVNGTRVEFEARLPGGNAVPKVELIVLTAFEGG
jgi:molybdopterin converting factor small subunit